MRAQITHKLVRATAIEMAGALYDELMRDNRLYAEWKAAYPALDAMAIEAAFIEMMWPRLIERARATLASMLHGREQSGLHDDIATALIHDNQFRAARGRAEARWRRKYGLVNGRRS
jgi:hypothetical protein